MILTRGLGRDGPLVTSGLGSGGDTVAEDERRSRSNRQKRLLRRRRLQILAEDRIVSDLIVSLVTNEVLN